MKPIIVQKYGGSSLSSLEKIKHVATKVVAKKKEGYSIVVVVSAMGDMTNELVSLAKQLSESPPRRELDMLTSVGERISMSLLSTAIQELGFESTSLTGSQSGIMTNDSHFQARIIEVRPIRIEDELEKDKIVIVAGFQGMSYKREITTLGRGGSDTTAVALTAALSAECCEIYSDIDGVYTADPRVVPEAKHLSLVPSEFLSRYAKHGAKVLHHQAIQLAHEQNIHLYAKATKGSDKQTFVRVGNKGNSPFWGITGRKEVVCCRTEIVEFANIQQKRPAFVDASSYIFQNDSCMEVYFDTKLHPDAEGDAKELSLETRSVSLLTLVTSGQVPWKMISFLGAAKFYQEGCVMWLVEPSDWKKKQRQLHEIFEQEWGVC